MHAFVRQTDGQTDGQTKFSSLDRVCIQCSAVKKITLYNAKKLVILLGIAVMYYLFICLFIYYATNTAQQNTSIQNK